MGSDTISVRNICHGPCPSTCSTLLTKILKAINFMSCLLHFISSMPTVLQLIFIIKHSYELMFNPKSLHIVITLQNYFPKVLSFGSHITVLSLHTINVGIPLSCTSVTLLTVFTFLSTPLTFQNFQILCHLRPHLL